MRQWVKDRADGLCEYCLVREVDRSFRYHVDHIISLKHGGATTAENLAYCCSFCNVQKGSDLGSVIWETGELARFFNPRRDRWGQHFQLLNGVEISPLTDIGEVTVRIFQFNHPDRLIERKLLGKAGYYPSSEALQRINPRT